MPTAIDEIIEQVAQLSDKDRDELIQLLQKEEKKITPNGKKGSISPNTVWIKEHHAEYAGNYVALKDGKLIAVGKTIKEADVKAREKGVKNPLLTYLFPLDEMPWGGW